jgi:hypothetical protein
MLLRLLRQFAAVICKELDGQYFDEVRLQPGRLFFPKRVHELASLEGEAPNGLTLEYIRLAVAKNEAVWKGTPVDTAVTTLAAQVSQQICRAALIERQLIERLKSTR